VRDDGTVPEIAMKTIFKDQLIEDSDGEPDYLTAD
jgi:hypothetical protein